MMKKEKPKPDGLDGSPRPWISKMIRGTYDHYTCLLPENIGRLASLLLKLFYSGIKLDHEQTEKIRQLEKNAVVVYVTKFKSNFDYLFYYSRYRQEQLPLPQIGFDYNVYLWQPVSRIIRASIARMDHLFRFRGLPDPYERGYIKQELINGRSGLLPLVGKKSFKRRFVKAKTDPIQYLIEIQESNDRPIYLVPQLMFFSKTARRGNPTLIDILFGSEDRPGGIRRLVTLFKNPGRVFVEVSDPVNLKHYLQSDEIRRQTSEYQSLVLRRDLLLQLNRHRQIITGPVRKSKEELKEAILTNHRFQQFMNKYAENRKLPIYEVRRKADAYIEEIAANYKPAFVKVAAQIVGWIVRTMFDGVTTNHAVLNKVKNMSLKGPLVLIPCHKSHIDYLILDYLLYHNNMPVPHIAAGKNLSFWPMGPLFRSGGAFFLRRSFGGAVLYSKVFAEYINMLLEEGYNIEQFIEGGRSRTGKLLMPKLGLMSILFNAYKNGACKDMFFVPIYIGYDRIIEEKSYLHELGGGQKEPENILQLIQARRFLKKRYGKIYIQFHEPISLNQLLSRYGYSLAKMTSKEQNRLVRDLGYRLINAINRITVVTPHALVASAILNISKEKFSLKEVLAVNQTYMKYLASQNAKLADTLVSDQVRVFEQVVDLFSQRKFIEPTSKDKQDKIAPKEFLINEHRRLYLEYYKNNCIAFFIPAAYTAMALLEKDTFRFSASDLHTGYAFWQNFFKYEFAYDVDKTAELNVRKNIKAFIDDGIVIPHQTLPDTYDVTPAGFRKLKLFTLFLKTYLESYWIVINYYMRNPQNALSAKDRLKKISARGNRMYKRKEIAHKEALSKANYQNAVDFFSHRGIKGCDDTEQIQIYADAIQKALNYL
ncbi:MAG: glycerol-3-phosphate acyltransferase [Desulfobacterales bacterium]|nr:glycerol-3-phosphate acyltransferase [Desulfobacterales bacterium]